MKALFSRHNFPKSKPIRLALGICLLIGGILGFLPVLGFWMIPLGLLILSVDFSFVRRFRRRSEIFFGRKINSKNK